MVVRSYDDELQYLEKVSPYCWRIKKGFQPNMNVEGVFYVNQHLEKLMLEELRNACRPGQVGGFLPGVKQIANVAALPGIVGRSVGLPDVHSGYGFAIGNMAAFDMEVGSLLFHVTAKRAPYICIFKLWFWLGKVHSSKSVGSQKEGL